MADIFTSVEFYIIAFAVAAIIAAFFGFDNTPPEATSDIYSPHTIVQDCTEADAPPTVTLRANEDGSIEVIRHGITLVPQCTVYVKADFVKDRITFTERLARDARANGSGEAAVCDAHFTTRRRPGRKYYIRYECADGTLWGATRFANYGNYATTLQLRT